MSLPPTGRTWWSATDRRAYGTCARPPSVILDRGCPPAVFTGVRAPIGRQAATVMPGQGLGSGRDRQRQPELAVAVGPPVQHRKPGRREFGGDPVRAEFRGHLGPHLLAFLE